METPFPFPILSGLIFRILHAYHSHQDYFQMRSPLRRMHNGLDIKVYIGDTIRAAFDGRVRMVKYERRGYGKYVVIRHDNGLETIYGHLSKQIVAENEYVKAGDPIGLGGNTGRSTVLIFTLKPASWVKLSIRNLCLIFPIRIS